MKIDKKTGEIFELALHPRDKKSRFKTTVRPDGSFRVQQISNDPVITDQAAAQDLTMLSIVKKLEKGIMPNLAQGLIYTTDLGVRNLQDVVERQNEVNKLFYNLPVEIRKLMHHDISNFEKVLFDPKHSDVLAKHGLTTVKRDQHQELLNAVNALKPLPDEQKPASKV